MRHKALDRFDSLIDTYYAVPPARRGQIVARVRAALGRSLAPGHAVLRDFDAHQATYRPEALANIAAWQGVRALRPWEWVTHLCRSVDVCEFMLCFFVTMQAWIPRPVVRGLTVATVKTATQWRRDLVVAAARSVVPGYLVPLVVAQLGAVPIAVNVNRLGWGWARLPWWRLAHAEGDPDPAPSVPWLRLGLASVALLLTVWPTEATSGVVLAALSANTVWEMRTAGAATNGGGFVTGASGTDHSQQDAAQYSVTDGVTAGTTTITSVTANFGTDVVGNIMYVAGGTGSITAGWYQITVRNSATSVTVDRSTGLTTGTGVTLKIGGALSDPALVAANIVSGNLAWQKAGTYSITSASTNVAGGCISGSATNFAWQGYQTTRGDLGTAPLMQASGITTATIFATAAGNQSLVNLAVDGATLTALRGFSLSRCNLYRSSAVNCPNVGIYAAVSTSRVALCTASGCSTATGAIDNTNGASLFATVAHDNTTAGFVANTGALFSFCIADTNTGASSDGFTLGVGESVISSVAYANGRDGFRAGGGVSIFINDIGEANAAYGFNVNSVYNVTRVTCATYNNTSGAINGTALFSAGNVTGSGSFFTNAASGDFSLNTTAGAGAAARAVGIPGAYNGAATTGYLDIGAAQHQDPAGGSGGYTPLGSFSYTGISPS